MNNIKDIIKNSISVKEKILKDDIFSLLIKTIVNQAVKCLKNGNTIWWCGNGGSAADAQHLAAELSGVIYSRYLKGCGKKGDMLIGISTSGNSKNIVNAFKTAQDKGITTIGMTGETGGDMAEYSNFLLNIPSNDTPRIQESHIMLGHIICELIENKMFR